MESRTTRQFWRLFSGLPLEVQRDAQHAYRLFQENAAHPGLQFKKLQGEDNIYSSRIGIGYRAARGYGAGPNRLVLDWESLRLRPIDLSKLRS